MLYLSVSVDIVWVAILSSCQELEYRKDRWCSLLVLDKSYFLDA